MSCNVPVRNESYMNCQYEIVYSYDPRSYDRNFCNCVKKPEKQRTSTGFEPVTSRYRLCPGGGFTPQMSRIVKHIAETGP